MAHHLNQASFILCLGLRCVFGVLHGYPCFSSAELLCSKIDYSLNCQSEKLPSALSFACDFKSHFANSVDPGQSDQGPQCLPDGFLGALRVKGGQESRIELMKICIQSMPKT